MAFICPFLSRTGSARKLSHGRWPPGRGRALRKGCALRGRPATPALAVRAPPGVRVALVSAPPPEEGERKTAPNPVVRLFATADLRSLGVMRIVLGLLLIVDLLPRIAQVDALFSNDGVLTNHFALFRPLAPYQFSFYIAASSTRDVTVVFLLTLV